MRRIPGVVELIEQYRRGDLDPVEHVYRILEAIGKWEPLVNAYISLESIDVMVGMAEEAAARYRRGEARRLEGILVAVKDNISTSFLPTTAGSRMLDGYIPPYNATVVDRLLAEGAIIVGKTNLDEFAMGSTTELSAFFPTRNPWDPGRVPGGSSGGSGAVLAYGGADVALGSDTGGSVRLPATYTATVGLKPTYGLVSRYGLIPYGNSLEQISPMARSVRDAALILDVIAGHDPLDAASLKVSKVNVSEAKPLEPGVVDICIFPSLLEGAEGPIRSTFNSVVDKLSSEGACIVEEELKTAKYSLPVYYTIAFAEAASNLARYDGVLYPSKGYSGVWEEYVAEARGKGFGLEVKRRILMGVYALSEGYREEYYLAAAKARRLIRDEIDKLTRRCILALPASPILPPRLGERVGDPLKLYLMDVYTVLANLAGVPALVQPAGFYDGLPIGIQWMAGKLEEEKLVSLGLLVEDVTGLSGVVAG
ncbi:MAG: aspartyl/glutamyl-tRNA amidotransferase subunit A [Desulfurococcales archaeon]|nr:aspartyl/glutamyl-tRNA amidotransferase subunit A [Desulfurococcales archaeon]